MKNTGLSDFYDLVKDFGTVQSVVLKIVLALPLLAIWLKLAPPTGIVSAGLLSLVEFIVLMVAFTAWGTLSADKLRRRFFIAIAVCFVGLAAVLYLSISYTVRCDSLHTVIIGTQLRTDVAQLITPSYTTTQALADGSCDPYNVWTGSSINMITGIFLFAWFLAVSGFTGAVVAFVLYHRQRSSTEPESAPLTAK
jgi:hypothetical protein